MYKGKIYNKECSMQGGPYTLLIFKEEFDEDLTAFVVDTYNTAPPDIEAFLRIAWAMCKTYDESTPSYEYWLEEFDNETFSLLEGQASLAVIDAAINAELFREKTTKAGRLKERIIFKFIEWCLKRRKNIKR